MQKGSWKNLDSRCSDGGRREEETFVYFSFSPVFIYRFRECRLPRKQEAKQGFMTSCSCSSSFGFSVQKERSDNFACHKIACGCYFSGGFRSHDESCHTFPQLS